MRPYLIGALLGIVAAVGCVAVGSALSEAGVAGVWAPSTWVAAAVGGVLGVVVARRVTVSSARRK